MTRAERIAHWDERFLKLAHHVGQWSKDRTARTGCVIVDRDGIVRSTGYNGFVRGVADEIEERHARPQKYEWTEHAERNAIYNAARIGVAISGCTLYVNWFPCGDCARAVVQAGLSRLVGLEPDAGEPKWGAEFLFSKALFLEVGLEFSLYDYPNLAARVRPSHLTKTA
jgi:dCMP deaminase